MTRIQSNSKQTDSPRDDQPNHSTRYLEVTIGNQTCWIGFQSADVLPVAHLDLQTIDNLPDELLLGLVEMLFEETLRSLSAASESTCQLTGIVSRAEIPADTLAIGIEVLFDDRVCHFELRATASVLSEITQMVAQAPLQPSDEIDDLIINVPIEMGTTSLTSDALKTLEPHDLIVIDNWHGDPIRDAIALMPPPLANRQVTLKETSVELTSPSFPKTPTASKPGCVELSIRTFPVRCSSNDLVNAIEPITFPRPQSTHVDIWVNERTVASGQLIVFNKTTAIAITHIGAFRDDSVSH